MKRAIEPVKLSQNYDVLAFSSFLYPFTVKWFVQHCNQWPLNNQHNVWLLFLINVLTWKANTARVHIHKIFMCKSKNWFAPWWREINYSSVLMWVLCIGVILWWYPDFICTFHLWISNHLLCRHFHKYKRDKKYGASKLRVMAPCSSLGFKRGVGCWVLILIFTNPNRLRAWHF